MSINLQKISDAINAKISSFGSSSPTSELVKIIESINNVNAHGGVITAPSKNALPLADSSNSGTIAFVRSTGYTDSAGTFYFGTGTDWSMLTTLSDSADSAGAATVSEGGGSSFSLQGSTYGYTGAIGSPHVGGYTTNYEKYAFAGGSNSAVAGDLTVARTTFAAKASSAEHGYALGGDAWGEPSATKTTIDRFPFASDGDATDVGTLTVQTYDGVNGDVQTADAGYIGKAYGFPQDPGSEYYKYSFSSSVSLAVGGSFTASNYRVYHSSSGNSSTTHGYINAGRVNPYNGGSWGQSNMIEKFPFASEGDTTDVGDLTVGRYRQVGLNSTISGYTAGGAGAPALNVIDKFPFASDGNATDVGDLLSTWQRGGGSSETTAGYIMGGMGTPDMNYVSVIQSFPFASDGNATNTNDTLATGGFYTRGFQI